MRQHTNVVEENTAKLTTPTLWGWRLGDPLRLRPLQCSNSAQASRDRYETKFRSKDTASLHSAAARETSQGAADNKPLLVFSQLLLHAADAAAVE